MKLRRCDNEMQYVILDEIQDPPQKKDFIYIYNYWTTGEI